MDDEENVILCTAAIVVRKTPHSLILVLVVFARFIIKTQARRKQLSIGRVFGKSIFHELRCREWTSATGAK